MTSTTAAGRMTGSGGGDWKEKMGRVGIVGRGVMYSVIGMLAIQLALGDTGEEASNTGAIQWIAQQPLGRFLLVALTISLLCLAGWRLLDAAVGDPVEGSDASDRAEYAIKGVFYLGLAIASAAATVEHWSGGSGGSGGGSGDGGSQQATATVLEWPAGQWIVTAVGLGIIGYAIYMFKRHTVDEEFLQRLSVSGDGWVTTLGRFGYAARSVVFLVIGYFLVQAGLTHEPGQSKGLSGALREISGTGWGQWLLLAVAAGLLAFGLFSIAEAKYRRDA